MSRPIDPSARRGVAWRWLVVLLPGVLIWVLPLPALKPRPAKSPEV